MQQDFARNFIKGKIGEIIFDQMFREEGMFTVIPFGYDRTLPELAQYAKEAKYQEVIDNIRSAPDFALVSKDKKEVFLIEVKYRTNINMEELQKVAKKIEEKWHLVWMFICTPKGFYFNRTNIIIKENKLIPLSGKWICKEKQEKYLNLLNGFIGGK